MYALGAAQMQAVDARASRARGDVALMRAAGRAIAALVPRYASNARLVAFAGGGNNGGDAFAAFAELDRGWDRTVYALEATSPSAARVDAHARAVAAGVRVLPWPSSGAAVARACADAGLVLDGLLGVGSRLPLAGPYAQIVRELARCAAPVLALDIPTGIDATTGAHGDAVVRARATVTIGALKTGLLLYPARACVGDLWFAPIGFDPDDVARESRDYAVLDDAEFLALLPQRAASSDKRRSGAPLIVAGSEQFPGAAVLCAQGAARAGAGYVTVATPRAAAAALRAHLVEQVVVTWDDDDVGRATEQLSDLENHCSSLALGPGLPLSAATGEILRATIAATTLPLVADASMLFHLAKHLDVLRGKAAVLTPHAGEFARLSGGGTLEEEQRLSRLRAFVREHGVTTLLKGAATLVDNGTTVAVNATGTSALATAGTGDVLTGTIATLLAQGLAPFDAARAGAYWHGLAGRYAAAARSTGVMAGDLPHVLSAALEQARERVRAERNALVRRIS